MADSGEHDNGIVFPYLHLIPSQEVSDESSGTPKIASKLIARLDAAHGVHDVNTVVWCPREGMEGIFATTGDDGNVKVWKLTMS